MAEIFISKIKARRGTDQQRKATLFDQGEIVYTTDTKRLYVGNGLLSGGNHVSSKIHVPLTNTSSLSNLISEVGDITSINNVWYQLTANPYTNINNWGKIEVKISSELVFDASSTLNVAFSGLSAVKLNPNTMEQPIAIKNGKISLNYSNQFFELSNTNLSLKNNSITQKEILSSSFGNGLSGGNGNIINLKINPTQFFFDNGFLSFDYESSPVRYTNRFFTPLSSYNQLSSIRGLEGDIVSFDNIFYQLTADQPPFDPDFDLPEDRLKYWIDITPKNFNKFFLPLSSCNALSTVQANIGDIITCDSKFYQLTSELPIFDPLNTPNDILENWADITPPKTDISYSVFGTLTGNSTLNDTNSLSSIFNGTPTHTLSGGIPGLTITKFEAVSSNGVSTQTITLSSAGFLTFEGNFQTKTNQMVGRFAIPIFAY